MAKIVGPLMSLDASGSVAGTITFSKWKGRNYVRQTVTPSNPKSPAQTAFRAMFGFLSQIWKTLSPTDQGSWEAAGKALNASPFNGFVRENQRLWTQVQTPTANSAHAMIGTPSVISTETAVGGVRQIALSAVFGASATQWGAIIYRNDTTGFTPSQNDVIAVIPVGASTSMNYIDSNLTPGTYYYRLASFTDDGIMVDDPNEVTATAS